MSTAKDPFVEVAAGAAVFKEGDSGGDMFIIESGQVDIVRKARGDEPIATLGPGDFFGEMAILEDQPRFAGAIAKTNVRLLRIELAARHRRAEQRAQEALTELAQLKSAAAAPAPRARDAAKPKVEVPAAAPRAAPEVAAPVAAAPAPAAPAPAPPVPAPAAPVAVAQNLALRIVASGQVLLLEPERSEFLVGRPDPVTGIQPEINLGPFDTMRTLSRRHAKILKEGGLYFVREEVGTTNGTFVNGERIKTGAAVPLKPGNRLRFGSIEVEVVAQ